jgi:hypothetical protein
MWCFCRVKRAALGIPADRARNSYGATRQESGATHVPDSNGRIEEDANAEVVDASIAGVEEIAGADGLSGAGRGAVDRTTIAATSAAGTHRSGGHN